MPLSNLQKNLHLLWRAGFGPSLNQVPTLAAQTPEQLWKQLLTASQREPEKLVVSDPESEAKATTRKPEDEAERRELRRQSRQASQRLNILWLEELVNSPAQLRERMAFFWHGHFATRIQKADYNRELLHLFRTHALGNFGTLLSEVSKSPAMLSFLNNQQNRKQRPNENFAREVMELFTLGRGNYTEKDIREAARAFTGWGFAQGTSDAESPDAGGGTHFVFRPRLHDEGEKTFLGQSGAFRGEEILQILLQQRQTARFITGKIYRYFVHEEGHTERIEALSKVFYESHYDIPTLLKALFTAPWFYAPENVGNRIKSPIELLAGLRRMLPMTVGNPRSFLVLQNVLGQTLLQPPNVAGWPMGKAWIDSSSLVLRMQLPQILAGRETLQVAPQPDDDVQMGRLLPEEALDRRPAFVPRVLQSQIDWSRIAKTLEGHSSMEALSTCLLLHPERAPLAAVAAATAGHALPEKRLQATLLYLMSLPEYQLS